MIKTLIAVITMFLFAVLTLVDTSAMSADSENVPPICNAVRSARSDAGITQAALAQALGVSQPQVSAWESNRKPDVDDIRRIEEAIEPGRLRGWLLRSAGYVDDATDLRSAIDAANLPKTERALIHRLLNSFGSEA